MKPRSWNRALAFGADELAFLDAAVAINAQGSPGFALTARSPQSRVFTICRALFEYLHDPRAPAIVTRSHSDRQKRNRAFAAEFLAPATELRKLVRKSSVVTEEQIQDLAVELGTSAFVIQHQIENHRIAKLAAWRVRSAADGEPF